MNGGVMGVQKATMLTINAVNADSGIVICVWDMDSEQILS